MITVAIDGPSGAGKSLTASLLSQRLGILHLNTGALYRALAVYLNEHNIDALDEEAVKNVLDDIDISVDFVDGKQKTLLNGKDVTDKLYNSIISSKSSQSSSLPSVRDKMLNIQRTVAKDHSVIMEGRDITSHVLPHAKYKFYLTAQPETRAQRRHRDMVTSGEDVTYNKILEDILQRDKRDTTRKVCPLVKTEDSILVSSDKLTAEQVVEYMYNIIKEG